MALLNTIPDSDPLDRLLRLIKLRQAPAAAAVRPGIPGGVQLGGGIPLGADQLADGGWDVSAEPFDLANSSSTTIVVGNLSTALGPAIHGCKVMWQVVRDTGADARVGGGEHIVLARYYNGTGHGAWMTGSTNQGDVTHRSGVSITADINGDNLRLTWTADASGADTKGQYWIKTFAALQETAP
jgi:hypothetical protein